MTLDKRYGRGLVTEFTYWLKSIEQKVKYGSIEIFLFTEIILIFL